MAPRQTSTKVSSRRWAAAGLTTRRRLRRRRRRDLLNTSKSGTITCLKENTVPRCMQGVRFDNYIRKILRRVKPRVAIKRDTLQQLDSLMKNTLHHIAREAGNKMGRRKVLKPKMLSRALRRCMPKTLRNDVEAKAQEALQRYTQHKSCR
ncbi:uncharacterized protein LOC101845510 [Aplysia californica]|uniref:Uncharacterized protein LOC101845510 n=1 Tax=Aplysia californica TaxID=6500 RepID=A0ABM0K886_APLCA|nr:uncharacterized protein LOC101845510 [Aplysia californica]